MIETPMNNNMADVVQRLDNRQELADFLLSGLKADNKLRKQARSLTYYCPNKSRCTLVEVFKLPAGTLVHTPRYKVSDNLNRKTSNESGRASNTEDGNRHWKSHAFFTDAALNITLNCDHVRQRVVDIAEVEQDIRNGIKSKTMS